MKKIIIFMLLIIAQNSYSQQNFEQIAFDYFLKNIITIDYPNLGKIKFSGTTELATSGSLFSAECLNKEENQFVIENGFKIQKKMIKIHDNSKEILNKKPQKERNEKLFMRIYQTLKVNDKYIVSLIVTEKGRGANYYYIFDKDYEIIMWCKTAFLI